MALPQCLALRLTQKVVFLVTPPYSRCRPLRYGVGVDALLTKSSYCTTVYEVDAEAIGPQYILTTFAFKKAEIYQLLHRFVNMPLNSHSNGR